MSEYEWKFKIDKLEFSVFSIRNDEKAKLAKKFVCGGTHFAYISESGKFHSSHVNNGHTVFRMWRSHLGIVRQAHALGVLDKKTTTKLIAEEKRRSENRAAAYAAHDILRSYKEAGIALTAAQLKGLRRLEKDLQ